METEELLLFNEEDRRRAIGDVIIFFGRLDEVVFSASELELQSSKANFFVVGRLLLTLSLLLSVSRKT